MKLNTEQTLLVKYADQGKSNVGLHVGLMKICSNLLSTHNRTILSKSSKNNKRSAFTEFSVSFSSSDDNLGAEN